MLVPDVHELRNIRPGLTLRGKEPDEVRLRLVGDHEFVVGLIDLGFGKRNSVDGVLDEGGIDLNVGVVLGHSIVPCVVGCLFVSVWLFLLSSFFLSSFLLFLYL